MKKIKVAFIIDTIHEKIGGTERQLILLIQNLDRNKFEPYLCCFKDSSWLQEHSDICTTHIFKFQSFFSPYDYWRLFRFSRYLKDNQIDIVQTHFRDGNIIGVLSARLAGIKNIISTRRNQGYWHNSFELNLLRIINPFVCNFLANSNAVKKYVHRVEKIPIEKIDVIYNGFDLSVFKEKDESVLEKLKKELDLKLNHKVITIVANLRPVKAIDVLLKSYKLVYKNYPNTVLLIVGDGPEKENLENIVIRSGLTKNIRFLGSRQDIPDILAISDIGVLSSQSEGLSNSIIEYMASGLPSVVTDVGGNSELVSNGENGYVVSVNNDGEIAKAIISLLENHNIAIQMGQIARKKAELFQLGNILNKTSEYYMNLFNSSNLKV